MAQTRLRELRPIARQNNHELILKSKVTRDLDGAGAIPSLGVRGGWLGFDLSKETARDAEVVGEADTVVDEDRPCAGLDVDGAPGRVRRLHKLSPGELVATRGSDGMAVDFGSGEGIARYCSHWAAARTTPSFPTV
jgi:hypothetical protein